MSKHWIIRIKKPSTYFLLSAVVSGASVVCLWLFLKRFLYLKSRSTQPPSEEFHSKIPCSRIVYDSLVPYNEAILNAQPIITVSNQNSDSTILSCQTSPSSASSLPLDCKMIGLGTLNKIVDQLEECIEKINRAVKQASSVNQNAMLLEDLRKLLETSCLLREQFRRTFPRGDLVCAESSDSSPYVDTDSYFSALEEISLSELELHILSNYHRPLYRRALRELTEGNVTCR